MSSLLYYLFLLQQNMTAPIFTTSLEPANVTEGQEARFHVEFDGEPAPAVKWFRYSFPVENSDDFKVINETNKSTLIIKQTCQDDSGIFTCLLENLVGSSKASTNLTVVEAGEEYVMQASTKSKRTLKEMQVNEGDNIRFDIQFTAGDKSNLTFFHDGKTIKEEDMDGKETGGVKISVENDVATLLIANATPKNSGTYECHMKTDGGEATCSVMCNVIPKAAA